MATLYNIYGKEIYHSNGTVEQAFLEAVKQGVDLTAIDCEGMNLPNQNITGAKLFMAKLRGGNFTGTVWDDCDLRQADMQKSDCSYGKFTACNIEATFLNNSQLQSVTFENCHSHLLQVQGCNLIGSVWTGVRHGNFIDFSFSNLSKSDFRNTSLLDPDFGHSKIDGVKMPAKIERGYISYLQSAKGVDWSGSFVKQTQLNGSHFEEIKAQGLVLNECEGTDLSFSEGQLEAMTMDGKFTGLKLSNSNLSRSRFEGVFEQSALKGTNLSGASSTGANFMNSIFESVVTDGAQFPMSKLQGSIHIKTSWLNANLNMSEVFRTEFHDSPINPESHLVSRPLDADIAQAETKAASKNNLLTR